MDGWMDGWRNPPKKVKMWKIAKILIDALVVIFDIYGVDFSPQGRTSGINFEFIENRKNYLNFEPLNIKDLKSYVKNLQSQKQKWLIYQ